jgi:hypothetical protein
MRTVRRLYFYLLALISLEVVIWGLVTLLRTVFSTLPTEGTSALLARGMAFVIVSLPIFLVHWLVVQGDAGKDVEEHNSRLRSLFLYSAQFVTLLPAVHSILAIINRNLMVYFGRSGSEAMVGYGQTLADNAIAVLINLAAWAYFHRVLNDDLKTVSAKGMLKETRRLYRYAWVIYGLSLCVIGIQEVLGYILFLPTGFDSPVGAFLGNGIAFLLVGVPLFIYLWQNVQHSLVEAGEQFSSLRLVVLYGLIFIGAATFLISTGIALAGAFEWAMGYSQTLRLYLDGYGNSLSVAVPFGMVWAYFYACLKLRIEEEADPIRRENLLRPYDYAFSLAGSATVFFGAWAVFAAVVEMLAGNLNQVDAMRSMIAGGIAMLVIGIPLWLVHWQRLQNAALQTTDIGDHSRRSILRKGYIYLAVFATVVGGMAAAGMLFYLVFTRLIEGKADNFLVESLQRTQTILLILVWFVYHLRVLRQDGAMAHRALGNRHAVYPVLVFEAESETFAADLVEALKRQAPRLPVYVHNLREALGSEQGEYKAVALSSSLALNPPGALQTWLKHYLGTKIVVPLSQKDWLITGANTRSQPDAAKDAAAAIRQMAEGLQVKPAGGTNPWLVVGIVLGILFGFPLLMSLLGLLLWGN